MKTVLISKETTKRDIVQEFLPVNDKEKAKLDYLNILLILIWEFSSASSKGIYFKPQLLKTQKS